MDIELLVWIAELVIAIVTSVIITLIAGPLLVKLAENGRFTSKSQKNNGVTH